MSSLHNPRQLAIISVIAIISVTYGLFFYLQNITENEIRGSLFAQQEQRQQESNKAIAQHIESDLRSIVLELKVLTLMPSFQDSDLDTDLNRKLAEDLYVQLNTDSQGNMAALIDRLYVVDRNNVILIEVDPLEDMTGAQKSFEGVDVSSREYVQQARTMMSHVYSKGYKDFDGQYRIAISYPIISQQNGEYLGLVTVTTPTSVFFQHYGNIYDIQSQYLAVLDRDSVQLVHPVQSLVGTPFFGEYTQEATGHNEVLNNIISTVMGGQPSDGVYEFRNGERLTSGYPVFLLGEQTYFIFVITPTSTIYAQVDDTLSSQRIETFSLLAGTSAAVVVLIIFLVLWNSNLDRAVRIRTAQLEESNKQLSFANERLIEINEQLKTSEKMQKEFINIAAHELRTPIQPIMGLTEVLLSQKNIDPQTRSLLQTMDRSVKRLHQLSSDILDVSRIEGNSLRLNRHVIDLDEVLEPAIEEARRQIRNSGKVNLVREESANMNSSIDLRPYADRERIYQVISNLLHNAIKFTEQGTITVRVEKNETQAASQQLDDQTRNFGQIIVQISDTGTGIDPEIMPRLFTKFASKSEQGTGLGLFISKNIIEAHGGRIWANNNPDGLGATFGFSLPVVEKQQVSMPAEK